jgi:hypothetical protein
MIMESLVGWKEGGCHVCASSHGNVVGETNGYRGDHLEMMNQAVVEAIGKRIGELMEADVGVAGIFASESEAENFHAIDEVFVVLGGIEII